MDEALRGLLDQFRDKFKCNGVSGCPAQDALLAFGWTARPYVEQVFASAPAQASYRARSVWLLGQLADPMSQAVLRGALRDRDPEIRGYAAYGLARLGDQAILPELREWTEGPVHPWTGPAQLSAWWALWRLGEVNALAQFIQTTEQLASHPMAGPSLVWASHLCADTPPHTCDSVLPRMAQHPAFLPRRAALRAMAKAPQASFAPVLVLLLRDPVQSVRDLAQATLVAISGRGDLQGLPAWETWLAAQQALQTKPVPADSGSKPSKR
jgi:HEAT repeat protein